MARARTLNFRMIEMYEEKTRRNRRTRSFTHLTKRLRMHVSCFVCTEISTPKYTQSFIHLAPGVTAHDAFKDPPDAPALYWVPFTPWLQENVDPPNCHCIIRTLHIRMYLRR